MREIRINFTVVLALSGLACVWVLLFHAAEGGHVETLRAAAPFIFDSGQFGIAVLFTLNGFAITHSLAGETVTPDSARRFLLRRSIRLVPAYWVSILVTIGFAYLSATIRHEPHHAPTASQIIAHMFYIEPLMKAPPINPVYWALSCEIQFCIVFAAMLAIRSRWTDMALWILAILSARGLFGEHWAGLFVQFWGVFYAGSLARRALVSDWALAGLALLTIALLCGDGFARTAAITALFLFFAARSGWAETGLNWRWVRYLGTISYSLFLMQVPLADITGLIAHSLFGKGPSADLITLALIVMICLAGATAFWWAIERPLHRLAHHVALHLRRATADALKPGPIRQAI